MAMQDIKLPKVETRKEFMDFLTDSINPPKYDDDDSSKVGRLRELTTYILESDDGFSSLETDELKCSVVNTHVEDIKILCVNEKKHGYGNVEFYLETNDNRFFLLHTSVKSEYTSRIIDALVRDLKHTFDHTWFYSNMLKDLSRQTGNYFEGFSVNYSNEYLGFNDDFDNIKDLNLSTNGSSAKKLQEIIASDESFASKIAFSKIRIARGDTRSTDDSVFDDISNNGYFSVKKGKSVQDHLQLVDMAKDKYFEILSHVEDQRIGFKEAEGRTLFEGKSFDFEFPKPIENISLFLKNLFNARPPFKLWGMKTKIHNDYFKIMAIDLHTGNPIDFEISNDMMRAYLFKGNCGNTILRLFTNLQMFYDSNIRCTQLE